jgi:hypothetical protein
LSDERAEERVFAAQSDGVQVADDDAVGLPEAGAGVGNTLGGVVTKLISTQRRWILAGLITRRIASWCIESPSSSKIGKKYPALMGHQPPHQPATVPGCLCGCESEGSQCDVGVGSDPPLPGRRAGGPPAGSTWPGAGSRSSKRGEPGSGGSHPAQTVPSGVSIQNPHASSGWNTRSLAPGDSFCHAWSAGVSSTRTGPMSSASPIV